ncbi:MAG: hypothetical protein OXF79_21985 [Chloroflexi bacterium]|nr:hypothetical protein [Chloroflexota bacterium]
MREDAVGRRQRAVMATDAEWERSAPGELVRVQLVKVQWEGEG